MLSRSSQWMTRMVIGRQRMITSSSSSSPGGSLNITDRCVQQLKAICQPGESLRLAVDGGGCSGFEYKLTLDGASTMSSEDHVFEQDGVKVVVDEMSLQYMNGATVDYVEDMMRSAFRVLNNPIAEKGCSCGSSFAPKMD